MSYENFNQFLSNIKKLNNQQQDREETLRNAQRLFGKPSCGKEKNTGHFTFSFSPFGSRVLAGSADSVR